MGNGEVIWHYVLHIIQMLWVKGTFSAFHSMAIYEYRRSPELFKHLKTCLQHLKDKPHYFGSRSTFFEKTIENLNGSEETIFSGF